MESDRGEVPVGSLGGLIGFSPQMQRVYTAMHRLSPYPYPVLICGERGTGKESAARTIHSLGPHREAPFVSLDCANLAPTLFEPEFFGYAKSTFLGASHTKWGLMSLAGRGVLFLGEIAELPLNLQDKLLQTLEDGMFSPVGSLTQLPLQARIIAATHRDLRARVVEGSFREDLYLHLSVGQIDLPPLRERKGDIALLVDSFLEKYAGRGAQMEFSAAAMNRLLAYDWPRNVTELENTVRSAVAVASGPLVEVKDLNLIPVPRSAKDSVPASSVETRPVDELERDALVRALNEAGGNQVAAANRLGIGEATLNRRLKYHGLLPGSF